MAGFYMNTTSAIVSNEGGSGDEASSFITISEALSILPPVLIMTFPLDPVRVNQNFSTTFVLSNPNPQRILTRVGFNDFLPEGLSFLQVVSDCPGFQFELSPEFLQVSEVSLQPGGVCVIQADLVASCAGQFTNTVDRVVSNQGIGPGSTAGIVVEPRTNHLNWAKHIYFHGDRRHKTRVRKNPCC
jgi:hypothetical protein